MSYLGPPPGYRHPEALQHRPGGWVPADMWYADLEERNRKAHEDARIRSLYPPKFAAEYLGVKPSVPLDWSKLLREYVASLP